MRIEYLEEFVVLAKRLSFTKAAQDLYIAQPTLSSHIKSMESELGVDLISRGLQVELTPAGKSFLDTAQRTLNVYRTGCAALADQGEKAPLRICLQNSYAALDEALGMEPSIPHEFAHTPSGTGLFDDLASGRIDVLVTFDYERSPNLSEQADSLGIASLAIDERPVSVGMMRTNPLSQYPLLRSTDLDGAVVDIPDRAFFDSWKEMVSALMPSAHSLSFRLIDKGDLSNYWQSGSPDGIVLCDSGTVEAAAGRDGNLVTFDELDGEPIMVRHVLAYRKDDGNANLALLLERLRENDVR